MIRRRKEPGVTILLRLGLTTLLSIAAGAAEAVVLGEAVSRIFLRCYATDVPVTEFVGAIAGGCNETVTFLDEEGVARGDVSTSVANLPSASVSTECVECPVRTQIESSGRLSFQLAVVESATPPTPLSVVPVRISTEGEAAVTSLGLRANASTHLSETLEQIFSITALFNARAYTAIPLQPQVLSDSYSITETRDLIPDHVYFGALSAECSNDLVGDWQCSANVNVSFALDQIAFDARMGESSFDLSQYVSLQASPNLVPEPSPGALGATALAVLAATARARQRSRAASSDRRS